MARCPGCNKFAGLELQEPEVNDENFDGDSGQIAAEVRIVRTSTCCGEEMKEATLELEGDASSEIDDWIARKLEEEGLDEGEDEAGDDTETGEEAEEREEANRDRAERREAREAELREGLEMTLDVECEEDTNRTDRHGKPITNYRYQATVFKVKGTATIAAADGETVATVEMEAEVRASEMDELN